MLFRKFTLAISAAMLVVTPAFAAKEQEAVKVTSPNNLQGTQKVTIGQFTIGFLTERRDSAKAGGGLMGSGFGGRWRWVFSLGASSGVAFLRPARLVPRGLPA